MIHAAPMRPDRPPNGFGGRRIGAPRFSGLYLADSQKRGKRPETESDSAGTAGNHPVRLNPRRLRKFGTAGEARQDDRYMPSPRALTDQTGADGIQLPDAKGIIGSGGKNSRSSLINDRQCRGAATGGRVSAFPSVSRPIARPGRTREPYAERTDDHLTRCPPDNAAGTERTARGSSGGIAQQGRPEHG